jgi:hypothetical protein
VSISRSAHSRQTGRQPCTTARLSGCIPSGDPSYLLFMGASLPKRLDRRSKLPAVRAKLVCQDHDEDRGYIRCHQALPGSHPVNSWARLAAGQDAPSNAYARSRSDRPEPAGWSRWGPRTAPVIAWHNGSVPEIIEDARTGFVVGNMDDAVRAVANAGHRAAACAHRQRFNAALWRPITGSPQRPARSPSSHGYPSQFPVERRARLEAGGWRSSTTRILTLAMRIMSG